MEALPYTSIGCGRPVILVHGWTMHRRVWGDFARELAQSFRVIAVDLRGHGDARHMQGPYTFDTLAQDIVKLISALRLGAVTLVGWSMGASVVLKVIEMSKARIEACVLMSGNPSLVSRPDYSAGLPDVAVKRLYRRIAKRYPAGLAAFYDLLWSRSEKDQAGSAERAGIGSMTSAPPKQAALELLQILQKEDVRTCLDSCDMPALIVHGDSDRICVPEAAEYMNRRLGASRVCMLKDTGHVPFFTKKNEVLEALRMFLR